MKIKKLDSGIVVVTANDDTFLSAFSVNTYVHIDPRNDKVIRLSTSADPEREDESYFINQSVVTIPASNSRDELFEILVTNFFTSNNATSANQQDIISKLTSLDSKTYDINPKIEESPQELLRQIHSGLDILTEQQIITNNLLKLILS